MSARTERGISPQAQHALDLFKPLDKALAAQAKEAGDYVFAMASGVVLGVVTVYPKPEVMPRNRNAAKQVGMVYRNGDRRTGANLVSACHVLAARYRNHGGRPMQLEPLADRLRGATLTPLAEYGVQA